MVQHDRWKYDKCHDIAATNTVPVTHAKLEKKAAQTWFELNPLTTVGLRNISYSEFQVIWVKLCHTSVIQMQTKRMGATLTTWTDEYNIWPHTIFSGMGRFGASKYSGKTRESLKPLLKGRVVVDKEYLSSIASAAFLDRGRNDMST